MRRDGKFQRGWKRDRATGTPDASEIFRQLAQREMRDLETCRQVWEREGDPLALCEAIRQSNLPDWLTSSLLFTLTDGSQGKTIFSRRRLWRDRTRNAIDAELAWQTAEFRSNPNVPPEHAFTWEMAYLGGNIRARERYGDVPALTVAGMKKAYARVRRGITRPWRYYRARPGMGKRIDEARIYMRKVLEASLAGREK